LLRHSTDVSRCIYFALTTCMTACCRDRDHAFRHHSQSFYKWNKQGVSKRYALVHRCIVCAATVGGLQRFFAMAGRFGTSAAFTVSYIYTAELFPTVVRSIAMGCTSVSARAGGIVAPIVVLLGVRSARTGARS